MDGEAEFCLQDETTDHRHVDREDLCPINTGFRAVFGGVSMRHDGFCGLRNLCPMRRLVGMAAPQVGGAFS